MAGISSKASGALLNKYGITTKEMQNKEFSDGSGLEEYDFGARFYDQQIGRWHNIDPHVANYYWLTPYNYCNNNPIKYLDPSGMDPEKSTPEKPKDLQEIVIQTKPKTNNSLANRTFGWANFNKKESDQWRSERSVYEEARNNGWSKVQMNEAWSKAGISDDKLKSYETGWQAEQDYRNSQLITVGILGAPLVAIAAAEIGVGTAVLNLPSEISIVTTNFSLDASLASQLLKNQIVKLITNEALIYSSAPLIVKISNNAYTYTITGKDLAIIINILGSKFLNFPKGIKIQ